MTILGDGKSKIGSCLFVCLFVGKSACVCNDNDEEIKHLVG